jgi:malate/lactate dehydrogenase
MIKKEYRMKVAVLGAAGGIGQALALLLKTQLPSGSELSLYDIAPVSLSISVISPQQSKSKVFAVKMRSRLWLAQTSS